MPIYEYTCSKCKHPFDQLVRRMDDGGKVKCPKCGANADRALSVFAVGSEGSKPGATGPAGGGCHCGHEGGCAME